MPSTSMRNLARRLLALEAAIQPAVDPYVHEAVRVCEKLRISIIRFAGADGFTALLRRALALARADVPALRTITIEADCSMDGLKELAADAGNGGAAIAAHLLGLLATFIGEPFTLRLVRESWPDAALDN